MSDQLVKIGMTCAVIVLGAAVLGSQLSSSPSLLRKIGQSEDAGKSEHAKKATSDADEEAEPDTPEESNRDEVASGEGSDSEEQAAEKSSEESEGDIKPEEDTADASGGEDGTADNDSGQGDDGEVIYNGIPAGTETETETDE
jgi:hypothetical protein